MRTFERIGYFIDSKCEDIAYTASDFAVGLKNKATALGRVLRRMPDDVKYEVLEVNREEVMRKYGEYGEFTIV